MPPLLRPWPVLVAVALSWIAYANAVPGEFVYDDTRQIVENRYIQEGRYFWTALTSDVWAYKGEREEAWSNYWRPVFVAWMMVNYRLFGLAPAGWHVTNILLHSVVVILAWGVLRRLGLGPPATAATVWLFAAHPAHVESVTWISGSPDLLVAALLLGSYLLFLRPRAETEPRSKTKPRTETEPRLSGSGPTDRSGDSHGRRRGSVLAITVSTRIPSRAADRWVSGSNLLAWGLFAGATLCKEVAVLFPVLISLTEWSLRSARGERFSNSIPRALAAAGPYVVIAFVYLLARMAVLGTVGRATPWAPSTASMLLTLPALLTFYLRQVFWPITLGPAYPLRAVTEATLDVGNFIFPVGVVIVVVVAGWWLWRRGTIYRVGLALFILPLLPAMNIAAFLPEQIVHDRYLYLPLLGVLLCVFGTVDRWLSARPRRDLVIYLVGLVLAAVAGVQTVRYNRAWQSEITLWEQGVRVDPDSAHTRSQLGHAYLKAERYGEAKQALERASDINPDVTEVILSLAALSRRAGRFDEAERAYQQVLAVYPDHEVALDQLAKAFEEQGKLADARQVLMQARERLPYRRVKYTMNVGVLSFRMGEPQRALSEIESIRAELEHETAPELLRSYFFLGELYRSAGRIDEARDAYKRFLDRTPPGRDAAIERLREQVRQRLQAMPD